MLVQCPSCHTTYRIADGLITTPNPTFRCSRCKHIFIMGTKDDSKISESKALPPQASPDEADDDRELSFSFPPRSAKETKEEKKEEREEQGVDWNEAPGELSSQAESFTFPDKETDAPVATTEVGSSPEEDWKLSSITEKQAEPDMKPDSNQDTPISTVLYLSLLGGILLIYSMLALMHQTHPDRVEGFLKAVPGIGPSIFRNNHLARGIALRAVAPSLQKIRDNREVFVISGSAVNHSPVSMREIRIEGTIYNTSGEEIERQTISVGNAISLKIISGLNAQDIPILQKMSPLRTFQIAPEEAAGFAIVFLKPTGEIRQFSCRVVSAEEAV